MHCSTERELLALLVRLGGPETVFGTFLLGRCLLMQLRRNDACNRGREPGGQRALEPPHFLNRGGLSPPPKIGGCQWRVSTGIRYLARIFVQPYYSGTSLNGHL